MQIPQNNDISMTQSKGMDHLSFLHKIKRVNEQAASNQPASLMPILEEGRTMLYVTSYGNITMTLSLRRGECRGKGICVNLALIVKGNI